MILTLRCYAFQSDQKWEAICTDLDVATFAASLDEVKASLATCIELYLEGVNELPAEEWPRLLARRTPWQVRAKLALMTRLSNVGSARRFLQFSLRSHVPAHP